MPVYKLHPERPNEKYTIEWFDENGKRHRELVSANKRVAQEALAARMLAVRAVKKGLVAKLPVSGRSTAAGAPDTSALFGDWLAEYERDVLPSLRSSRTVGAICKSLREAFGDRRIDTIMPIHVEGYRTRLEKRVSVARANRHLAYLRRIINLAIGNGRATRSPFTGPGAVRLKKEQQKAEAILTAEQVHELLEVCKTRTAKEMPSNEHDLLYPFVALALNTGLRCSSLLGLKWREVDLGAGVIRVEERKDGKVRTLALSKQAHAALSKLQKRGEFVFTKHDGTRLVRPHRSFKTALKLAGLPASVRIHDLRHTFAGHWAMNGKDLMTLKEILGHSTLNLTMRYARLSPGHATKEMATFEFESASRPRKVKPG